MKRAIGNMSQEPTFSPSHGVRPSFCVIFICPFTWLCVMFGFWQLLFCTVCYGLPWWLSGEEFACQCRRCRFHPWVRKFPWRRECLPAPVFLPGKSHGQRSLAGYGLSGCNRVRHDLATNQQPLSPALPTPAFPALQVCLCQIECCLLSRERGLFGPCSEVNCQLHVVILGRPALSHSCRIK